MASIRKVDYYSVKVPQRPGAGAALLAAMKPGGVNLLAFHGFPAGSGAQVDFMPANSARFRRAAQKAGLKVASRKTVFLVQGADKVGALTSVLGKLSAAKINLVALTAVTAGKSRYVMLFRMRKEQ